MVGTNTQVLTQKYIIKVQLKRKSNTQSFSSIYMNVLLVDTQTQKICYSFIFLS